MQPPIVVQGNGELGGHWKELCGTVKVLEIIIRLYYIPFLIMINFQIVKHFLLEFNIFRKVIATFRALNNIISSISGIPHSCAICLLQVILN